MTRLDDLATVLELACLTEDRSDAEQRALLRAARRVDQEANKQTASNPRWRKHLAECGEREAAAKWMRWAWETWADATRTLVDNQKPVKLPRRPRGVAG